MLLHNVLRILAAGDCEIVITTDNVGPFVKAAKEMLRAFGVQPNPGGVVTRPLPQATSLSGDQWRAIERARDFLRVAAAGPRTLVAVTLASIWSGALILSCDEARSRYNHQPGAYRVLPLSATGTGTPKPEAMCKTPWPS